MGGHLSSIYFIVINDVFLGWWERWLAISKSGVEVFLFSTSFRTSPYDEAMSHCWLRYLGFMEIDGYQPVSLEID
jgi:hypothetical protein